jgi:hypothetical protein
MVGVLTLLMLVYVLLMEVHGIDVISILRGDKLIIVERIQYIPKAQYIVDVAYTRASMDIVRDIHSRAAEWGIDIAPTNTQWVRHSTDSYAVYVKK